MSDDGIRRPAPRPGLDAQHEAVFGYGAAVYDETVDVEGAAHDKTAEKELERKAEERRLFLVRLLGDPEARAWLREFLADCHAFETRFASTGYGPDPYGTFLLAGEQKAGWHLWEQLDRAAPDLAALMRRDSAVG